MVAYGFTFILLSTLSIRIGCMQFIIYSVVIFIPNRCYACNSKWQAFKLATLSGLAEPLGVIIVGKLRWFLCSNCFFCTSKCSLQSFEGVSYILL